MGFFYRKSKKIGPFRINLSKSGIGLSTGVKGLRYSVGPRGSYVTVGRRGVYYRKKISSSRGSKSSSASGALGIIVLLLATFVLAIVVKYPILLLVGLIVFLLSRIRKNENGALSASSSPKPTTQPVHRPIIARVANFAPQYPMDVLPELNSDGTNNSNSVPILYELDDRSSTRFNAITEALSLLGQSTKLWFVDLEVEGETRKDNTVLTSVQRKWISLNRTNTPPRIVTNVQLPCLDTFNKKLIFCPDRVLVFDDSDYAAVPYEALALNSSTIKFQEKEDIPTDSETLGWTWQHVNKNGSRDNRYSDNDRIPIVKYGEVEIEAPNKLSFRLIVSNLEIARRFEAALSSAIAPVLQSDKGDSDHQSSRYFDLVNHQQIGSEPVTGEAVRSIVDEFHYLSQLYAEQAMNSLPEELQEIARERKEQIYSRYRMLRNTFGRFTCDCDSCNEALIDGLQQQQDDNDHRAESSNNSLAQHRASNQDAIQQAQREALTDVVVEPELKKDSADDLALDPHHENPSVFHFNWVVLTFVCTLVLAGAVGANFAHSPDFSWGRWMLSWGASKRDSSAPIDSGTNYSSPKEASESDDQFANRVQAQPLDRDVDPTPTASSAVPASANDQSSPPTPSNQDRSLANSESNNADGASPSDTDLNGRQFITNMMQADLNSEAFESAKSQIENATKPPSGDPVEATNLNKLGLTALKSKDYPRATTLFKAATTADHSDPIYLSNLGYAEMQNGDYDAAIGHNTASLVLAPSRPVAWGNLGEAYAHKEDTDSAVSCFCIGYKESNGDTAAYLRSLARNDDPAIRKAAEMALTKLRTEETPSVNQDSTQ